MQTMERNTELGLVHLYWGGGKGKTTAALGLALRAVRAGHSVAVVQFLKEGNSGEVALLRQLGAHIFRGKGCQKFVRQMSAAEREHAAELQTAHLRMALALEPQVLILDEACAVWQQDMVDRALLHEAVLERPAGREVVLTGRVPADWMRLCADYETECRCCKHPYERGIPARRGVEF